MSTGQENKAKETAFETRDFYLACFLRCTGYDTWENGEVVAAFRQPFDMLAETTGAICRKIRRVHPRDPGKLIMNDLTLDPSDSSRHRRRLRWTPTRPLGAKLQ